LRYLLPANFQVGKGVLSLIEHDQITTGLQGTIIGPCSDLRLKDKAERVLCDFGEAGTANLTIKMIEHVLPNNFRIGDSVNCLDHAFNLMEGLTIRDVGAIKGPCDDDSLADSQQRLLVAFEGREVNVPLIGIKHIKLAGGYRKGYCVESQIDYGSIRKGDKGVVTGAMDKERLLVNFQGQGQSNGVVSLTPAMIALVPGETFGE